ncbi:MAG TPA: hypothetical protein VFI28_11270 [Candidatus Limnocylindrales bacterium]|nr:hypothetical protein [Candidatus Limnocylindrales bacterium]
MDVTRLDLGPERDRRSIVRLIADGVLDARLASLAWLLVGARVPLVVAAGPSGTGKTVLLRALLAFLPPAAQIATVAGAWETWGWLPAAVRAELGVVAFGATERAKPDARPLEVSEGVVVVPEFSMHLPGYSWGSIARTAIRLASMGYGLGATIHADSLGEVLDELGGPGVGATPDELSAIGLVLVLRAVDGRLDERGRRRVVAAHFVRPLARDAEGHVQRLPPAVLSTWDPVVDTFEDFSWGVLPELAARIGRRPGDLELEVDRRTEWLEALVAGGVLGEDEVGAAISSYLGRPPARA